MIKPVFEELSDETQDVKFCKVDVDAQADIAQECGIQAVSSLTVYPSIPLGTIEIVNCPSQMPTFVLFKNGTKHSELRGAVREKLEVRRDNP